MVELIKGDIIQTVPDYIINNKDIKIALLHIDVDLYEPSIVILDNLYVLNVRKYTGYYLKINFY